MFHSIKGAYLFCRIDEYADESLYEVAIEMIMQNAKLLNEDAYKLIEELIYSDCEVTEIFLEYYHEYIEYGYVLENILEEVLDEEDSEAYEIDFGEERITLARQMER